MRWQQKLETFIDAQRQEISDALTFNAHPWIYIKELKFYYFIALLRDLLSI